VVCFWWFLLLVLLVIREFGTVKFSADIAWHLIVALALKI